MRQARRKVPVDEVFRYFHVVLHQRDTKSQIDEVEKWIELMKEKNQHFQQKPCYFGNSQITVQKDTAYQKYK